MAENRYLVFARKWRPQTFEDVVGQEHITRTLQNAISSGRVAHAFLFIGSRGIGKTTTARVLAKALNCLSAEAPTCTPCNTCDNCRSIAEGNNIDVIEIDGASNNGVDDVREIRENVRLVPSRSRFKIYIIDEVHQLSAGAFNALLKTIEEPPAHAVFILATTESHKVPATIISRCQRFDFRRVSVDRICDLLQRILDKESLKCTPEALQAIARAAEGGIRDAESILDQLVSYCDKEITFQDVFDVLGLVDWQVMHDLCDAICEKDIARQLQLIEAISVAGKDLAQFVQDILRYFRNLLVCKTGDAKTLLALPDEEIARMQEHAGRFTLTMLIRLVEQFAELTKGFDSQLAQRIALETLLIRISKRAVEFSVDTVIEKIMQLSEGGVALPSAPAPAPARPAPAPPAPSPEPVKARSKAEATPDTVEDLWGRVAEQAAHDTVSLQVALNHARVAGMDGDTVVLWFPEHAAGSRDVVEKPEYRKAIESALAELTSNLKRFQSELMADAGESKPAPAQASKRDRDALPASARVSADDARAALSDPHVAKVVDVFKGRVVEVKHDVKVSR